MHYANGRPAKNGDKVLQVVGSYQPPVIGVLYGALPDNDYCNGWLAPLAGGAHMGACLADCVHLDDVLAALHVNPASNNLRGELAKIPRSDNDGQCATSI